MLNNVNALLYATVPVLVPVEQLNPNVFVAVIFAPEYFFRLGLAPSNPPWNGRINLRVVTATFVVNVPLYPHRNYHLVELTLVPIELR